MLHPLVHKESLEEGFSHGNATILPISDPHIGSPRTAPGAIPSTHSDDSLFKGRCYDRPGRKPAADLERDPVKLYDKICKERGGNSFATDWILTVFKHGVNGGVLARVLTPEEITAMDFTGGFEPQQVYDGFITKIKDRYKCGLCKEGKETHWKTKKSAPRHLRKFHFGLADTCDVWYVRQTPDLLVTMLTIISELLFIAEKVCTARAKSRAMPVKAMTTASAANKAG
jgi:hypothetical protein